ncbi:MAG: gephyrin-like molybdotransferase Glp [Pseudomonadota bacterium]
MLLISVEQALAHLLNDAAPIATATESVDLLDADTRVLATDIVTQSDLPPFDASAMDGYAVRNADLRTLPTTLRVVGEAAAGTAHAGAVNAGEAVRIFTGAPVPDGADAIVIQENTARDGDTVTVTGGRVEAGHIRRRGFDSAAGTTVLQRGTILSPRTLTLAAALGHPAVEVLRQPRVAVLATGNELVLPGTEATGARIVCSNPFGVVTIARRSGADAQFLGIAKDTEADLNAHLDRAHDADIVVTIGGASVGDHDLVGPVLKQRGVAFDFWKVAMRPGKPLMFGRGNDGTLYLGLPGNPVSALVCARVFLAPLVAARAGRTAERLDAQMLPLSEPMAANGPRKHFMRAVRSSGSDGADTVRALDNQDSSLLTRLAAANALIVREPSAEALDIGDHVAVLGLDF